MPAIFGLLVKMALRAVSRRPFRTGVTLAAVGFSFALTLLFIGLTAGSHEQMIDMALRLQAGHVVITAPGYSKDPALEKRIADPQGVFRRIGPLPASWRVSSRILTTGLLRSSESSVMLDTLMGVDPEAEREISLIFRKITRGSWVSPETPGILVGEKAAQLLQVDVGDKVVLSCSGVGGQKVEERLEVIGVFKAGGETDRSTAIVDRAFAARFLGLGSAVHQIAFFMPSREAVHARDRLRRQLAGLPLDVLHWEEALPVLAQLLWLDNISMYVFLIIIFGLAAAGILNSVLMSVMERTREFGILRSLGMPPRTLFFLVMLENLLMAVFSIAVGCALGLPLMHWLAASGLDPLVLTGGEVMEMEGVALVDRIYPILETSDVVLTSLWVAALSLAGALFPAIRAARMPPMRALRA